MPAGPVRWALRRLVAEVSMGRAGLVLGLEVSRLARNSVDWQRLLEICALTDTLILDEDGVYNPANFNDRLLLGLKGTMSEAELHAIRARLRGGILNKARRGELRIALPVGLVYDANERVVLDPNQRVQQSLKHLFRAFHRTGSATATVKEFRAQQLEFPRRLRGGPRKGELVWGPLTHTRVLRALHSPRYAGAFTFGRHRSIRQVDGSSRVRHQPRDQWYTLLRDAHPGYVSWEEFESNQQRLRESAQAQESAPRGACSVARTCGLRRVRCSDDRALSSTPGSIDAELRMPERRDRDGYAQVPRAYGRSDR
jgi:DNA invertase Pin-like site-specific DNA recombinase